MDKHFCDFMYLYSDAVSGSDNFLDTEIDFQKTVSIAVNQGVLSIVMPLLKKHQEINALDSFKELYNEYLRTVVNNEIKIEKTERIINRLQDAGIKCCLLKGKSLSDLYSNPQTRISGDTDILVDEKDELKALSIFEDEGFSVEHRTPASNHSICMHEQLGCVELHVKLYYDFMEDVWFNNITGIQEPFREKDGVYQLGYTDGYLYVFLHAVKHFISGGLSVRHFSDILLYSQNYKDKINFTRTEEVIKNLKYDLFEEFIYFVGDKYFGIKNIKNFRTFPKEIEDEIFSDMLKGGIFGKNEKERARFFEIYNERRFSNFKKEDFNKYMTSWRRKNAKKVASFSKNNIIKRYPDAYKSILHYIAALFSHSFFILRKVLKRKKLVNDVISYKTPTVNESAQKRLSLLEKMKMI